MLLCSYAHPCTQFSIIELERHSISTSDPPAKNYTTVQAYDEVLARLFNAILPGGSERTDLSDPYSEAAANADFQIKYAVLDLIDSNNQTRHVRFQIKNMENDPRAYLFIGNIFGGEDDGKSINVRLNPDKTVDVSIAN